jgi:hypothetical protein
MSEADCWARVVVVGPDQTRLAMLLAGEGRPDFTLTVLRAGGRVCLQDVCSPLGELLDLAGLRREVGG